MNIFIALALALFLFRRITSKLDILVDNSQRLSAGMELNPVMRGKDEISILDRRFHEMAGYLKEEEELLRNSEERVRSIIEKMPIGLMILTDNGMIEFVNSSVEQMFNCARSQLIKVPFANLFVTNEDIDTILSRAGQRAIELTAKKAITQNFLSSYLFRLSCCSLVNEDWRQFLMSPSALKFNG